MKTKRILTVSAVLLLIVTCCCFFVGCKSAAEKENAYYDELATTMEKYADTLNTLTEKVFERSWKANFMYSFTYYRQEKDGVITNNCITRGSAESAGWPSGSSEYVHFMYFEVDYTDMQNYTVKTTTFEDTGRKNFYDNKDKPKNYAKKFKQTGDPLTYQVANGVASGTLAEDINPIHLIEANVQKQDLMDYGISASDHFRIYTHFMRFESRQVLNAEGKNVTRAMNTESNGKYWSNYGDDVSYDWNNVYGLNNNRLTVLYSKGKKRINQLEIYNEEVISYYTKKDKVNTQLVLKADVVRYYEAVIEFDYK